MLFTWAEPIRRGWSGGSGSAIAFYSSASWQAWWIPYLFRPEPVRAARYQVMFGATHSFLPQRNGIRVNTLHFILHLATLTTLVVLSALTA